MFEQNAPSVAVPTPHARGADRRAFVRYACGQAGACYSVLPGEGSRWPATICDVSAGGLSLVVCRPFNEGEILAVELQRPVEGLRDRLFARVRRASTKGGGVWIVGCRFVHRLNDGELDQLR